jgi:signal transduction histidine kinase
MRLNALLQRRQEYRVLALMLLLLHVAIWSELHGAASRSLMLAHLGLFLIWQPIWQREERLQASAATISVLIIFAFVGWLDWWAVTIWLLLLTGLVGGRTTEGRTERSIYMLTLVFLVSELLLGAVPQTFGVTLPALVDLVAGWGLPVLPLVMIFIPARSTPAKTAQAVDFLYGVTMSLLCSVLALGSLLRMYDGNVYYTVALFQTVLAVSGFMLAISWLWAPFAGFSGLGQMWTRYLMNIGTPFEQWLSRIAGLSRRRAEPSDFIAAAMRELVELPWVNGVSWHSNTGELMQAGTMGRDSFSLTEEGMRVTVCTHAPPGPALLLHGRLLVGLLTHFYRAKQREVELTRHAHLEAVHETGARLTHDIKNLLQSLHTMTSAMERAATLAEREAVHGLLERQLPALTSRLQTALEKLQQPALANTALIPATDWWQALLERHEYDPPKFTYSAQLSPLFVPAELFDSVTENLLDNALLKRQTETDISIEVELGSDHDEIFISVTDSGSEIDAALRSELFSGPVHSRSGFGIGLYQAARHAELLGFELKLEQNQAGRVQFRLRGQAADASLPASAVTAESPQSQAG